jgi:hypothetical protein
MVQIGPANAAPAPAPVVNVTVASSCGWETAFYPDTGYETRLTHNEKVWIVEHNEKVKAFCQQVTPGH